MVFLGQTDRVLAIEKQTEIQRSKISLFPILYLYFSVIRNVCTEIPRFCKSLKYIICYLMQQAVTRPLEKPLLTCKPTKPEDFRSNGVFN